MYYTFTASSSGDYYPNVWERYAYAPIRFPARMARRVEGPWVQDIIEVPDKGPWVQERH
jgi:hypothetical protein